MHAGVHVNLPAARPQKPNKDSSKKIDDKMRKGIVSIASQSDS